MTKTTKDNDQERKKGNMIAIVFLATIVAIGIPHTCYLDSLFETASICVPAYITLPFRQRYKQFTIGTTPAFKCKYYYKGEYYTAIIDKHITEEEYRTLYVGDTVVLRILKSKPERARWDKSFGIRHYVTP